MLVSLSKHTKTRNLILLIILSVPLLFINIKEYHNWGDDFALYLHQAKNLAESESPQNTGLVYNEDNPIMIDSVGIGFSVLLAPVYALFGDNMKVFMIYISLFLLFAGLAIFLFLRKKTGDLIAIIITLLILYSRWMLDFKTNILSDIPFLFLLFLLFFLYEIKWKNVLLKALIIGILAGWMSSMKSTGLVFVLAIMAIGFFDLFSGWFKKQAIEIDKRKIILETAIILIVGFGVKYLLNLFFFPEPEEGSYSVYLKEFSIREVFIGNLSYYYTYFDHHFHTYRIGKFIHGINGVVVPFFLVAGIILKQSRKIELYDFFFIGYLLLVLAYPAKPGFRYHLPLMPLVFLYMYYGITMLSDMIKIKKRAFPAYILFLFLIIQYLPGIIQASDSEEKVTPGPQMKPSQEVFEYIREKTPDSAIFVFQKPRALAYYTDTQALSNNSEQLDPDKLDSIFKELNVNYLLENKKELIDTPLVHYLEKYSEKVILVYENENFRLYKMKADSALFKN